MALTPVQLAEGMKYQIGTGKPGDPVRLVSLEEAQRYESQQVSTVAPPTTDTDRYSRLPSDNLAGLLTAAPGKPPTEEVIIQQRRKEAQGLIDLIEKATARAVEEEGEAGEVRSARTRALNIAAGLGGSDFATAAAEETEAGTRKVIEGVREQGLLKIQEVLYKVDQAARQEAEQKVKQYKEDIASAQAWREKFVQDAITNAVQIGQGRVTPSQLKTRDRVLYDQLLKQTGKTELELDLIIESGLPESLKPVVSAYTVRMPNGNAGYRRVVFDPVTKQATTETYDLGFPYKDVAADTEIKSAGNAQTGFFLWWKDPATGEIKTHQLTKPAPKEYAPSEAYKIYQEAGGKEGTGKDFVTWYREDYKAGSADVRAENYDQAKQEAMQLFEVDRQKNDNKKVSPDLYGEVRERIPASLRDDFDEWAVGMGYLSEETQRRFGIVSKGTTAGEAFLTDDQMDKIAIALVKSIDVENAKAAVQFGKIRIKSGGSTKEITLSQDQINRLLQLIDQNYPAGKRTFLQKVSPFGK